MLRTAVRGAVDVLLSRSVLKREIRVDTTLLLQRDNNPLKFFPDGDSALQQMLAGRSGGYLPAQTALQGAFDDIRRHELAVLGGMRAAIQHLLGRFDPQAIAVAETAHHWLDRLSARRKAKQWDRFVALHTELARASADDLQALCGSAFNDAYERQAGLRSGSQPHTFTHSQRDGDVLE
jgi:FHA domain-containing protein/type VI secretion system protein